MDHYQNVLVPLRLTAEAEEEEAEIYEQILGEFFNKRRFFVRYSLLVKYVNSWERRRIPKTYGNIKLDFPWL